MKKKHQIVLIRFYSYISSDGYKIRKVVKEFFQQNLPDAY